MQERTYVPPSQVMTTEELVAWITEIYEELGEFKATGIALAKDGVEIYAIDIYRVVAEGRDSNKIRRLYKINKTDRTRYCFECTRQQRTRMNKLIERSGAKKEEIFEDFMDYVEKLCDYIDNLDMENDHEFNE